MSFKVNIDSVTLDILSTRLKGVVSPYHILQWLANFKENEADLAIGLLKNLMVFTSGEVQEVYHQGLYDILRGIPQVEKVAVLPVGAFGKSGTMMTYLLKKTNAYQSNASRVTLCPTSETLKTLSEDHSCLVLLDDFVGTGKSVADYFQTDIEPYLKQFKQVRFLGVAAMLTGKRTIRPLFTQLHIPDEHIYTKAFSADASYFGYRKHIAYRELAFRYGCKLTKPIALKSGSHKYVNALGFGNSQALVSFFYGSPNNTLPIFWQGDFGKTKWVPLIPRFSQHNIKLARDFRKKLSFELSLFKEFGSENLVESFATLSIKRGSKRFTSVSSIDFSLYGILKLQREGVHEFNICQRLGISYDDYMEYLDEGKKRGLFDSRYNLTPHGLELYEEANTCIKNSQRVAYEDRETFDLQNINYLPGKFNGRS
jgi:hypothetical protein